MEDKEQQVGKITGYTALTEFIYGPDLIWSKEDDSGMYPNIYPSENDVWVEIADGAVEQLTQFIANQRDQDDVDWNIAEQYTVVYIEIENEFIKCYDKQDGICVWELGLKEWREQM